MCKSLKKASFRTENNFVVCYLYVTFSCFPVLRHFFAYSGGLLKGKLKKWKLSTEILVLISQKK